MRYLADCDYDTIAHQCSLSDGALRGHLSRGLAALRGKLSGTGYQPVSSDENTGKVARATE
jgi:DNA-directed RNA polymerase specialized sigma24 family protein